MMPLLTNYPNKLIPGESHNFYEKHPNLWYPIVSKKIQILNPMEIEENQYPASPKP
jgi:hypothetical protein